MRNKIALIFCFLAAAAAMARHAWVKSPGFDEIGHLQAGYYHWQHKDFERGLEHPPFLRLWAAIPLNFLGLTDPEETHPIFLEKPLSVKREQLYGTVLVYNNFGVSADKIIFSARAMMTLAALLLLGLIYLWSKEMYGENGAILSLFLAATFPVLLGHGSLVNTDVGGAAAALLFLYSLSKFLSEPSVPRLLYCGLALGIAEASKLSNVILLPIGFFLAVVFPGISGKGAWKRLGSFMGIVAVGAVFLNASYRFQNFFPPHGIHPEDLKVYQWSPLTQFLYRWAPLPDFYLLSLGFLSNHLRQGFSTYLLGHVHSQGVWYYFPLLFLVRTPTVALFAMGASLYSLKKAPLERREFVLLFAAACYGLFTLFSKLNLGLRHLFFVYPLLFVLCGRISHFALNKKVLVSLVLFHLIETSWIFPDPLAFFNWPSGGVKVGAYYSSDLDYGQDLKPLGAFMKNHPGAEIILSYFGTALPEAYGISAQELMPSGTMVHSGRINSDRPREEFLAVSVSQIQGLMTGEGTLDWLQGRKPVETIGHTIRVYDITGDRDAHERLAKIYDGLGEKNKAERHRRRVKILS